MSMRYRIGNACFRNSTALVAKSTVRASPIGIGVSGVDVLNLNPITWYGTKLGAS